MLRDRHPRLSQGAWGETLALGVRLLQVGCGPAVPPRAGPCGVTHNGAWLHQVAGTEVPRCLHLRAGGQLGCGAGRPCSEGGSPGAACGCRDGGWDLCDRPVCRSRRQPHLPEFSCKFRPIACGARWLPSCLEGCCPWYCRATRLQQVHDLCMIIEENGFHGFCMN